MPPRKQQPITARKGKRATDPTRPPEGYLSRRTVNGHRVLTIDWWAIASRRAPGWYEQTVKIIGKRRFDREFGRDWTSPEGAPFYPEFDQWGTAAIRPAPGVVSGLPIVRGWDFGVRRPACVWLQYDPQQHHVWILNELLGDNVDIYTFLDLVLYASGQRELHEINDNAKRWAARLEASGAPPLPWFPPTGTPRQWVDYSGPEAMQRSGLVGEEAANQSAKVLARAGVFLSSPGVKIKARETMMRALLRPRDNDPSIPHIFFDPACPLIISAMQGGLVYADPTPTDPEPDFPKKDGVFDNIHDAMGYALVNHVPIVAAQRLPGAIRHDGRLAIPRAGIQLPTRREKREAEQVEGQQDMGYYETRRSAAELRNRGRR